MRIGLVDLDTSHPENWVPVLREMGHEVVGVFDHGDVYPSGYAESFARKHEIPRVFESLSATSDDVELAILHGCDWDQHVARARPFVEAGRAVLVDKPVAGNLRDLETFEAWAKSGVRLTGGSALRFCQEVQDYLATPIAERGQPHTALCGCAVDEYNYGIHAYSMLAGIYGGDATSVRHVSQHGQRRLEINWPDGSLGWLIVGEAAKWQPFYATIVSEQQCCQIQVDVSRIYRSILDAVLPYLSGEVADPPVPMEQWLAPERWALAAKQSWLRDNQTVALDELDPEISYDGLAFAKAYRAAKLQA